MRIIFCISVIVVLFSSEARAQDLVSVQIKEAKLRSKPQHWAPAVETLRYGDPLIKIKEEGAWTQVTKSKKTGYLQSSAISGKQIMLSTASLGSVKADAGEVVLAGKGFSKSTEEEYARNNSAANFSAVNKLEQLKVSDAEMQQFVAAGKLEVK